MLTQEQKQHVIKKIKEELPNNFELSYESSIDITQVPDEVFIEMEAIKKATIGTRDLIIDLIEND